MTKHHRGHRGVTASTIQSLRVKAHQPPRVSARSVACPVCGAPVGQFCVSGTGALQTGNVHISRRRLALRKMREEAGE